ncbi:MAG: hypothetical protein V4549_18135 [Bacteroidota bacterium]
MGSIKPILEQFAEALKSDVKAVSKGFAPTIESIVTESSLSIVGSPYISVLINGRAPTKSGTKKGSPTLQEVIYSWIQKHGIEPRAKKEGDTMTQLSLSYAISNSIHRHGTLLYQRGGGNNIFDTIINKSRIDSFTNSIGAALTSSLSSEVLKDFK